MSTLRITEIFKSIQGEGIWSGTPSVFVRVSGCNLRCAWCDTPYSSWKPEGPMMELPEIVEKVRELDCQHVVITGGEPMLFAPVTELTHRLTAEGKTITIETAGTVPLDVHCHLMSISPKLANSTPGEEAGPGWSERHDKTRLKPSVLSHLIQNHPVQLKFVVDPADLSVLGEIDSLLESLPTVDPSRILIMPEGVESSALLEKEKLLAPICIERGWRLCPRLHIHLFGDTRGT
jgi:7-carboxy-7-deazaguanine synthase